MFDMYKEFINRLSSIQKLYFYKQCKSEFLLLRIESDGKYVTKRIKQYFNLSGTEMKKQRTEDCHVYISEYVYNEVYDLVTKHGWKCCDWFADITQDVTIEHVRMFIEDNRKDEK